MKQRLIGSALWLTFVLAVSFPAFAQITTDPEISEMLTSVSADRWEVTDVNMQNFFTRNACSDTLAPGEGVTPARDFIASRYNSLPGLQVRLDPFVHADCPTKPTFNVIAWIPGARRPNQLVIVGGHYDSRTVNVFDATSFAPGANDSGGQTSVVLEIASALAGHSFDSTIVFMDFSGEEQGLFGSGEIAANLTRYFNKPEVIAMLNTDIPSGDMDANTGGDFQQFRVYSPGIPREIFSTDPDGTPDNTSPARGIMRYIGTWAGAYVPGFTMVPILREDRPGRGSDHSSFLDQGFAAVRIMERFECSPSPVDNSCGGPFPCPPPAQIPAFCTTSFLTDHQHNGNDLNQFVTPSYAVNIARVMASVAASLARAPGAPRDFNASGNAQAGVTVNFKEPQGGHVDHFVVSARSVSENFYHQRIAVQNGNGKQVFMPQDLGLNPGDSFFISVASVDKQGHESLFAYPEVRCDSTSCAIPPYAFNVTAPFPPPSPSK